MLKRFKSYLNQGYDTILLREWQNIDLKEAMFPIHENTATLFSELFWLFLVVGDWETCQFLNEWLITNGETQNLQWKIEGLINKAFLSHYWHDFTSMNDTFTKIGSIIAQNGTRQQQIMFYFLKLLHYLELQEIVLASDMLVSIGELLRWYPDQKAMNWFNLAQIKVTIASGSVVEAATLFNSSYPTIEKSPQDWIKFFWHEVWLDLLSMMKDREMELIAYATDYLRLAEIKNYRLEAKICHEAMLRAYLRLKNFTAISTTFKEYGRIIETCNNLDGWIMDKLLIEAEIKLATTSENANNISHVINSCNQVLKHAHELNNERLLLKGHELLAGTCLYFNNDFNSSLKTMEELLSTRDQWTSKTLQNEAQIVLAELHLLKTDFHEASQLLDTIRMTAAQLRQHDLMFRVVTLACLISWFKKNFTSFNDNITALSEITRHMTNASLKSWSWTICTYLFSAMKRIKDAEKTLMHLETLTKSLEQASAELTEEDKTLIKRNEWLARGIFYLNQMDFENLDLILNGQIKPWLQSLDENLKTKHLRHWFLFKLLTVRRDLNRALLVTSPDLQPSIAERLRSLLDNPLSSYNPVMKLLLEGVLGLVHLFNGDMDQYLQKHRYIIDSSTKISTIIEDDRLANLLLSPKALKEPPREREEKTTLIQLMDQYLELLHAIGELSFSADELLRKMLLPSHVDIPIPKSSSG